LVTVCLALLALLTVVQVAHTHPLSSAADRCPLCLVMHTAAPVAAMGAVIVLVQIERSALVFAPRTVIRHWHPKLFTRPPPAARASFRSSNSVWFPLP
jgi:hypothetical protein